MRRQFRYRELSIIRMFANVGEFIGKVGFAAAGFGVWCYVLGPLCRVFVTGIGTQLRKPWRPRLVFRFRETWPYAAYGAKASGSYILYYFYTNIDYPIVGYYFGNTALGIYRAAYELVLEPVKVMSDAIRDVSFSAFSRAKQARDALIATFIGVTRVNLVAVMGYVAAIFITCEDLLYVLWREKYLAGAPAVRILAVVGVLRALSFVVPPLLLLYILFAELLGDSLGFRSVALAWALGYPIAFAVLAAIALVSLDLEVPSYLRQVGGIPLCVAAAGAIAGLVQYLARDLSHAARLSIVLAAFLLPYWLLLATTQGITIRSIAREMRGRRRASE